MLKSETLTVRAVTGAYSESLFRKKITLRNPICDVSCISTIIQDGGQLNISNQNMSRNDSQHKKNSQRPVIRKVNILDITVQLHVVTHMKHIVKFCKTIHLKA